MPYVRAARFSFCFLAIQFLFCQLEPSRAFVPYINDAGQVLRWNLDNSTAPTNNVNRQTKAIRYYIGASGWSAANRTNEINAVRASFAQWQSIPGTRLKFEEAGLLSGTPKFDPFDGTNVVFWTRTMRLPNGLDISGLAAYTEVQFSPDNEIVEGDIVLNGLYHDWFTDITRTNTVASFVEAVTGHEIGHLIGLDHTPIGAGSVFRGGGGVSAEAGLSFDEVAAARWLYPATTFQTGSVAGLATLGGVPALGAAVWLEDDAGNIAAASVTRANGQYSLPMVPPGSYKIRVSPLDPRTSTDAHSLQRGAEISLDYEFAHTQFFPTTNRSISVSAGATTHVNWSLQTGSPLRITSLLRPVALNSPQGPKRDAITLPLGVQQVVVGVLGPDFDASAKLRITGDGITIGPTTFQPNPFNDGRNALRATVNVATNATPGLRSFLIEQNGEFAYANGFAEILPLLLDFNFDGLDDRFQRQYWQPFTRAESAPFADADGDRYVNAIEYLSGSNPLDPLSFFYKIIDARRTVRGGLSLTFDSGVGLRYQLLGRNHAASGEWEPLGAPVQATSTNTSLGDNITASRRFYRVQTVP